MGNGRADRAAKEATDLQIQATAVSFRSACMVIRKTYADMTKHAKNKSVYIEYNEDLEKCVKSRKERSK